MSTMVQIHSAPPMSYCKAVGQIISHWANLEWQVEKTIWALLKIGPKEGRLLTTQMNIRPKLEILKGLASRANLDDERRKALLAMSKDITAANDFRNKLAHGLWATAPSKRKRRGMPRKMLLYWMRGKTETRIMPTTIRIDAKGLRQFSTHVMGMALFMSIVAVQVGAAQSPSLAKS
ncbi:MAG: hypothetical protein WAO95_05055 [Burkholderiales bacterium]